MLVNSPRLRSKEWESLLENKDDWDVRLVVPEVVFLETVNVVRRRWQTEIGSLLKVKLGEFGLDEQRDSMLAEIRKAWEEYEQWLCDFLREHDVTIEPPPPTDLMELARRASEVRAPYNESAKKDGFRDTLIWLTAMAVARENPDEQVWFASDNHTDFGRGGNPNTDELDDCSIPFHQHLVEDLDRDELTERVRYVISVKRLEQHLAAQYAPITDAALGDLANQIEMDELLRHLGESATQLVVDPELAALPFQIVGAQIAGVREAEGGWQFSEGARRGQAGWTARFSVESEVDLSMFGVDQTVSEITKPLRLFGDVAVASDGAVRDLVVTSAEALPDDAMRVRWENRRRRASSSASFLLDQTSVWGPVFDRVRMSDIFSPAMDQMRMSGVFNPAMDQLHVSGVFNPAMDQIRTSGVFNRIFDDIRNPILDEMQRSGALNRIFGDILKSQPSSLRLGIGQGSQVSKTADGPKTSGVQSNSRHDKRSADKESTPDVDGGDTDAEESESG